MNVRPTLAKAQASTGNKRSPTEGNTELSRRRSPTSDLGHFARGINSLEVAPVVVDQATFLSPHGNPIPLAGDLFSPLSSFGDMMPERAQAYLSLLAESSTKPGAMQKHLIQLMARGAKVASIIADPMDGLTDVIADTGKDLLMKHLGLKGSAPRSADPAGQTDVRQASEAASDAGTGALSKSKLDWTNMPDAVFGATALNRPSFSRGPSFCTAPSFCRMGSISARGSADDSCLPPVSDAQMNEGQAKALTLLLSMMMSGATSGMAGAITDAGMAHAMPIFQAGTASVVSHIPTHASFFRSEGSAVFRSQAAMLKVLQAPSLRETSVLVGQANGHDAASMGGMAASTALRLLRADSKRMLDVGSAPSLGNLLGTVLDSVNESMDDGGGNWRQQGRQAHGTASDKAGAKM